MALTTFPKPGAYISGGLGKRSTPNTADDPLRRPTDPRMQWLLAVSGQLKNDRSHITAEMRRNMDLYKGRHWSTFGTNRRAPWKMSAVVNSIKWVARRKSALMSDAKPKVTYTTSKLEDSWQCDVMNAAWEEFYDLDRIQHKWERATRLSVIRKKAYLKLGYDPYAREGKGGAAAKVVDGINVYLNIEATSVHDAEMLYEEYTEPIGRVLERWPHLVGNKDIYDVGETEQDQERSEGTSGAGMDSTPQPAQYYTNPAGQTVHTPPYAAPATGNDFQREGKRCLIRECWTRPRGPRNQIEVETIDWSVSGEAVTQPKILEFADGHAEPLQTVITEGGVVYELPISVVPILQFASDHLGGLKVYDTQDAFEVVLKTKKVPLYPTGRRMIGVGNALAEDGANPFAHGHFPYTEIAEDFAIDGYYPDTSVDDIVSLQDMENRLISMLFDAAHLTSNPIWRLPLNSDLADEDVTNAPGAIMREDPVSLKLGKRERGPDMPQYVMQLLQETKGEIKEISGLTETATGGKFKGQQSAETVSMYQEAAGVSFRPSMRLGEQSIIEFGIQFLGIVKQFYTEQRIAQIKDDRGIERHVPYIGTHLNADMKMRAKAGSMLPTSPTARLNYVTNLMNTPAMDVIELLRNLEEIGIIESSSMLLKRLMREREDPRLQWLIPALQPAGGKQKKKAKGSGGRSARGSTPQKAAERM